MQVLDARAEEEVIEKGCAAFFEVLREGEAQERVRHLFSATFHRPSAQGPHTPRLLVVSITLSNPICVTDASP